ncbi:hypothetical protein [Clostridium sp. Marseille-P2415]|uniref:hypothetical protein n=1 Tax=Clostridium sp. Marseille-P2415 TaxID=1805471 RepID=UPI000988784D|nr:hypothetical protein [Clostridium sp. Marseille-P2415]
MKVKSKRIMLLLAVFTINTFMLTIDASAQSNQEKTLPIAISSLQNSVLDVAYPNANIIGWRYKSKEGKLYRRQYNYSRKKWIGEWELC